MPAHGLVAFAALAGLYSMTSMTTGCAPSRASATPARAFYGAIAIDADLAAAAARYDRAQVAGNRAELEELVADDYLVIGHDGSVEGKKELVDEFAHPGMRVRPFVVEKKFVRDFGSTVILGGWATLAGSDNGRTFALRARFVDVWTRRDGKWRVAFTELTSSDVP